MRPRRGASVVSISSSASSGVCRCCLAAAAAAAGDLLWARLPVLAVHPFSSSLSLSLSVRRHCNCSPLFVIPSLRIHPPLARVRPSACGPSFRPSRHWQQQLFALRFSPFPSFPISHSPLGRRGFFEPCGPAVGFRIFDPLACLDLN